MDLFFKKDLRKVMEISTILKINSMTLLAWLWIVYLIVFLTSTAAAQPRVDDTIANYCKDISSSAACLVEPPAAKDTDGDGVSDDINQCPSSSTAAVVEANGCEAVTSPIAGDGVHIIDDSDGAPAFTVNKNYTTVTGDGYRGTYVQVGSYADRRTLNWNFSNTAGQYDVHVRYIAAWNTRASYDIAGMATVPVDQGEKGDQWVLIGTYILPANSKVTVKSSIYRGAKLDAVALTPVGAPVEQLNALGHQGCLDQLASATEHSLCIPTPVTARSVQDEFTDLPYWSSIRGSGGFQRIMDDWCGSAFDTDNMDLLFNCSGHNDGYFNGTIAYNIPSAEWSVRFLSDPLAYQAHYEDSGQWRAHTGPDRMTGQHTYDGVLYHADRGTVLISNQNNTQLFSDEQHPDRIVMPETRRNLLECNWKTYPNAGLEPNECRSHELESGKSLGYPRSMVLNGLPIMGSQKTLHEVEYVDNSPVLGDVFAGGPAAGQGNVDAFGDGYVATLNGGGGYFTHYGADGSTIAEFIGTGQPGGNGLACCADVCLIWNGSDEYYQYTNGATELESFTVDGLPEGDSRVYSKFQCLDEDQNIFIGVSTVDQPVHYLKWVAPGQDPPAPPEQELPPPTVGDSMLDATGEGAFTVGLGFAKGAVAQPYLTPQVMCRKLWNNGSCKFAVASGYWPESSPGPDLTEIDATGISVSIDGVNISPAEPFHTESGSQMIEQHYRAVQDDLLVLFYIRQYKEGERHTTIVVENGYLNLKTPQLDYTAVVTIGDHVETHEINHYRNTSWIAEHREGRFAQVRQTADSLIASGLVPNYSISPEATPGSYQTYRPGERGNHTASMGATGYQPQIGLLPQWDAAYIANPSEEAYASVIANAKAIRSYRLMWRDVDTYGVIDPAKFPRWSVSGENKGGVNQLAAGGLAWERAHFPSTGYLAYLLTGDQVHLDTLAQTASLCYLVQSYAYGGGEGLERRDKGQTRGQAWCYRSGGMYLALSGDSGLKQRLANNMARDVESIGLNDLGISHVGNIKAYGRGKIGPWQQNFRVMTLGFLSDIEPLDEMANLVQLRDFNYRFPVGLLGSFCTAGRYTLKVGPPETESIADFYDWAEINTEQCAELNKPSATNYWANLLPAISYAVKHKAPNAQVTWDRVQAAPNYQKWMGMFSSNSAWGVVYD